MKLTVPRRLRATVPVGRLLATLALTAGLSGSALPAQAAPAEAGTENATGWYLALGDSVGAGYQPGAGDDLDGGYPGGVLDALQGTDPKLRLRNLSCSGEDLTTIMQGGRCAYDEGSQLAQALVFLRAHRHTTGLVTLTIGGNDVRRCVRGTTIDMACISTGMANVSQRLPQVLTTLRQAAPRAQVVVTNYYNPYLAAWFTNRTVAAQSQVLAAMLNAVIAGAATATGATTADVATAFGTADTTPLPNGLPTNVAMICQLTWMCTPATDFHPNDAGYAVVAGAVTDAVA